MGKIVIIGGCASDEVNALFIKEIKNKLGNDVLIEFNENIHLGVAIIKNTNSPKNIIQELPDPLMLRNYHEIRYEEPFTQKKSYQPDYAKFDKYHKKHRK